MKEKIKKILFCIIIGGPVFYLIYSGYFYILFMFLIYAGFVVMIGVGIWLLFSNILDDYLGDEPKNGEKFIKISKKYEKN